MCRLYCNFCGWLLSQPNDMEEEEEKNDDGSAGVLRLDITPLRAANLPARIMNNAHTAHSNR